MHRALISPYLRLLRSELKLKIISSLQRGDKILGTLKDEVNSSGSTILHALQDLKAINLTQKFGKTYKLTSLGVIEALVIEEAYSALKVLDRFKDFWLSHDVSVIPNFLLQRIGALQDSALIKDMTIELDRVHKTFQNLLLASKRVKGVSPIFHPDYVVTFQRMLSEGASIELILTSDVLNETLTVADSERMVDYIKKDKLRIFLKNDLRIALTVTENSFSLGLFTSDGEYDYSMDLISNNQKAIEWGEELFQHYLKEAKSLDLEVLKLL